MTDLMTYEDYKKLLESPMGEYYLGRWDYFKEVINIIKKLDVKSILEIGPGLLPIVKNADILLNPTDDHFGKPAETDNRIIYDITKKEWPIESKKYDLVIALQVWEHLDNKQSRAFRELRRISRRAILSFPYLWEGGIEEKPMHRAHRNIDKELIGDWTLNIKPAEIIEIGRTGKEFSKGKRLIYYFNFK